MLIGITAHIYAQAPISTDCSKELFQKGMLQLEAKNYFDALDYFDLAIKCDDKVLAENETTLKKWQAAARDGIITDLAEARATATKQQQLADSLQLLREMTLHSNQNIAASASSDVEGIKTLALWRALTQDPANKALQVLWHQQAEKAVDVYFREDKLFPHSDEVKKTVFSAKGDRMATLSADDKLWIWDFNSGVLLSETPKISNIYLSKNKRSLIAIGSRTIFAYDLEDGLLLNKQALQNSIPSLIFEKDLILTKNETLILKITDNQVIVWNWEKNSFKTIETLQKVIKMQCSPDEQSLFGLFGDGSLQYWSISAPSPKGIALPVGKSTINSFDLSKEQVIFSGLNVLHFYSLKNKGIIASHAFKNRIIQAFCLNDSLVISSHEDGVLKLWNSYNGELVSSLIPNKSHYKKHSSNSIYPTAIHYVKSQYKKTQNRSRIKQFMVSKDRKKIALVYLDGKAKLWNIGKKNSSIDLKYIHDANAVPETKPKEEKFWTNTALPSSLKMSPTDINYLCFSDDGQYLLALHNNSSITVWDAVRSVYVHTFYDPYEGEEQPISNVGFGPDDKSILAYSGNQELLFWSIQKPEKTPEKLGTTSKFAIDQIHQNKVLCNESEKTIAVFNKDYQQIAKVKHHSTACNDIIFHPSRSNLLLTTHQNNTVLKVWNLDLKSLPPSSKAVVQKNTKKKTFSFELISIEGELLLSDSTLNNLDIMGHIGEPKLTTLPDSTGKRTDLLRHNDELHNNTTYYLLDIKKVRNKEDNNLVDSLRLSFFSSSYTIPNSGLIKHITTNSSREYIMISTLNGNNYVFSWGKDSIELTLAFNSTGSYDRNLRILENSDLIIFKKEHTNLDISNSRKQTILINNIDNLEAIKNSPPLVDTLEIWNLRTRYKLGEIHTTASNIRYLDFEEPCVTWDEPHGKIVILSLKTGKEVASFSSKDGSWLRIESCLNEKGEILIGGRDGYKRWNLTDNQLITTTKAPMPFQYYNNSPMIPNYPLPVLHFYKLHIAPKEWLNTEGDTAKRRWYHNYLESNLEEILQTAGEDKRWQYEEILKELSKK